VILVEVIDQVPEALLICRFSSEEVELYLKIPFGVQLVFDVIKKIGSAEEQSFLLTEPTIFRRLHSWSVVYSLSNRNLQFGLFYFITAERAEDFNFFFFFFHSLGDRLSKLRSQKLTVTVITFFLQLQPHLLAINVALRVFAESALSEF